MIKPLIFGISGLELTEQERELFQKNEVAGFILFKRNIESREQLLLLIDDLKNLYIDREIVIFVDQEGGRVARIKPPIIDQLYPAMDGFSKMYEKGFKEEALKAVKDNHLSIINDLKKLGIDSGCSPVADLCFSYTDNIIGDRSFGNDVAQVVDLCSAAIEGITLGGGIAIIKHIPGHGRATCDSHLALPTVSTSLDELNKTDFEVFRQLSKDDETLWAMTAHIVFDALDSKLPVTLSAKAINFIRDDIGFKGTLLSDDICMHALHSEIDVTDILKFNQSLAIITQNALQAGCDIVLHCSGDIDEMKTICNSFDNFNTINLI